MAKETYRTAKGTSIDIGGMLVNLSPGDVIHVERVADPAERTSLAPNEFVEAARRIADTVQHPAGAIVHICGPCSSGAHGLSKGHYCGHSCECACHTK